MELIGHRGCGDCYTENTIDAVAKSAAHLNAVEVDIRRCGSGELVVFHDETVDRVTDSTGAISELSWETLQTLEVLDSGESIPRLPAVLDAIPAGVRLQLELKEQGLTRDVYKHVADRSVTVALSSFLPDALAEVQALEWEVPTGYLFREEPTKSLEIALEYGCETVHPYYDLCLETNIVEQAHAAGLSVIAWKAAKTRAEVTALRAAGVDGVTADRWDIAGQRPSLSH